MALYVPVNLHYTNNPAVSSKSAPFVVPQDTTAYLRIWSICDLSAMTTVSWSCLRGVRSSISSMR